jgi:hypothetical protein
VWRSSGMARASFWSVKGTPLECEGNPAFYSGNTSAIVAAIHVSNNLEIDFNKLLACDMTLMSLRPFARQTRAPVQKASASELRSML